MQNTIVKSDFFEKFIIRRLYAPNLKHKINFFRLFAITQKAGLGIRDALVSIRNSESNKGLVMIIQDIIDQLTQGYTLSQAMSNHDYFFHADEIALIQASETMGNLPDVLQQIADEGEYNQKITQKIKKAVTYPAILVLFSIIAVIILLVYVLPAIISMYPSQAKLPVITKDMLSVSTFLKNARIVLVFLLIGAVILYKFLYKYFLPFKIFIDKIMLSIPAVAGVIKTLYMFKFSRLLGQLYGAGVNPIVSLQLMTNSFANFFYKRKAKEIRANLEAGFGFAESMEGSTLFDPILIQIIHVGEETGNIGEVLKKMSEYYRDLLQTKIDILMEFLQPVLMIIIGAVIGLIVGSIYIPIINLVNVIQ